MMRIVVGGEFASLSSRLLICFDVHMLSIANKKGRAFGRFLAARANR
jgi:hypothetical protein